MTYVVIETTSTGLTWTLYLLATNPEIEEKVYQEIISNLDVDEEITMEKINKMELLWNCIQEVNFLIKFPRIF